MSRAPKAKPVDPWPIQATPRQQTAARSGGLSRELVDQIYHDVLGVVPVDPIPPVDLEPSTAQVPPVQPAGRSPQGRFSRGVSGNPKGRPKREQPIGATPPAELAAESLSAIALRQAARKIKAQSEQGEVELTLAEAAITKMVREALKGNTGHSRTMMQLIGRAEAEEAKRKREAFQHWAAVKEQAEQLYSQAEQAGEDPPLSVHPDDIALYADGTVTIVGPTNAEGIAVMRQKQNMVDYHVVNIAYSHWIEKRWIRRNRRRIDGIHYAELWFWDEQNDLPPRLKMTIEELEARLRTYRRYSGRMLHGFLRAKAEPHGQYVPPREMRMPFIIPNEVVDIAKANDIGARQLLPIWFEAARKKAHRQLEETLAASRKKPRQD